MPELNMHNPAPWLSVIGVGEDGLSGLSGTARDLIAQAEYVFGGARHLALVAPLPQGVCTAWPTPFSEGVRQVLALRGRQVVVLASGDPFFTVLAVCWPVALVWGRCCVCLPYRPSHWRVRGLAGRVSSATSCPCAADL